MVESNDGDKNKQVLLKNVSVNCPNKVLDVTRFISVNVAGALKKLRYLKQFVEETKADVVVVCESYLIGNDRSKAGDWEKVEKVLTGWKCEILDATYQSNGRRKVRKGGVMILYRITLTPFIKTIKRHNELQAIEMILQDNDKLTRVFGVYAPSNRKEKLAYWRKWIDKIERMEAIPTIIIGDLNVHPSKKLDVKKSKSENIQSNIEEFNEFMDTGWIDVWRRRNPETRKYTYYRKS
jgi:exonuclease III